MVKMGKFLRYKVSAGRCCSGKRHVDARCEMIYDDGMYLVMSLNVNGTTHPFDDAFIVLVTDSCGASGLIICCVYN